MRNAQSRIGYRTPDQFNIDWSAVVTRELQLAGFSMSGLKKLVKEPVEFIPEPGTDKTPEPSLMQITLLCAQHLSTGKFDLLNLSLSVKAAKANGGKFVQLGILALRLFSTDLASAQLLILHLQFDTVHIQFVDHLGSTLMDDPRRALAGLFQQVLRPLTQVDF